MRHPLLATFLLLGLAILPAGAQTPAARMVSAANTFLASLDARQKQAVLFKFDDQVQRRRWSNLPVRSVPRAGISLGDMTAPQREAAMALVASALSAKGLEKARQIMEGDEVLKQQSGGRAMFGHDLYFISFLGLPSDKTPWMLQFGGHHLALNITVAGAEGVLTPSLIGAQPGRYSQNGKAVRALGAESDKATALLKSLDAKERESAILKYRVGDLVLGPGEDGKTIAPEGLKASAMSESQRAMLLDLISEWAGIIREDQAATRMAELKADLGDTWFAWSGDANPVPGENISAYYRIQGPHLVIEYAPQGDVMHIHTMYRDPTNDYGRKLTAK